MTGAGPSGREVAVVGAGIVGMSCALFLQQAGFRVTVVDRAPPGSQASFGNAGVLATINRVPLGTPGIWRGVPRMLLDPGSPLSIRPAYLPRLLPWAMKLLAASRPPEVERISHALGALLEPVHDAFAPLLQASGATGLIERRGWLHLFETADAFAAAGPDIDLRRRGGVEVRILTGAEVRDFEPGLRRDYHAAAYYPDPAHALDPRAVVEAFTRRFTDGGGTVLRGAVTSIRTRPDGVALALSEGEIGADRLVIAAGAWSRQLCRMLGFDVPLDTERGYHVMLPASGVSLRHPLLLFDRKLAITPMQGGLRLAGTVEFAGLDAPPNPARVRTIVAHARATFPGLDEAGMTDWLGFRPSLPDSLPVIGPAPGHPSVLLAFGHGHLGFTLGPVTGRIIADLASDRHPDIDVTPFGAGRF